MSTAYFNHLAGVRGLAALVVLLSHVVQLHFLRFVGLGTPLHQISSFSSQYAVVVFFILSGYLIAHTLEMNIERNGRLRLGVFAAARFARLYPPLVYAIGIALLAFLIMDLFALPGRARALSLPDDLYAAREVVHLSWTEIGGALLMLQGMLEINGPLWSLYMEAKLYALYACALALSSGRRSLLLILVFLGITGTGLKYNPGFAGFAAVWLTGALAYYLWDARCGRRKRLVLCGALFVFIVIVDGAWAMLHGEFVLASARDVAVAFLIAWLLFRQRIYVPVYKWLSDCSYSLYVTHFPVLLLAQSLLLATGSTSIGAAIGVAIMGSAVAAAVALIGGAIEAKKPVVESWLVASAARSRCVESETL